MKPYQLEAYQRRLRDAPKDPVEETMVKHATWYVQHRHGVSHSWFTTWVGERHLLEADGEKHEILAHQALDRASTGPLVYRMLRKVETAGLQVEVVPPLWDVEVPDEPRRYY